MLSIIVNNPTIILATVPPNSCKLRIPSFLSPIL
ncbi:BnaA03g01320D [Brassica napus]|uniref:BnaA03g01320D protein n=1 Tax=Brassica napus TaxID=3708 RepID=A0A078FD96_BRANA|nr:BnaA03g01320D [Brassica napus]